MGFPRQGDHGHDGLESLVTFLNDAVELILGDVAVRNIFRGLGRELAKLFHTRGKLLH